MNTRVSVVVIGRNEGERLLHCLQSVQAIQHSYFDIELIYVDSASHDNSPSLAASCGARVLQLPANKLSAAGARNLGWQQATGSFVMFLDGDTELHPLFIETALQQFTYQSRLAAVWGHRREKFPQHSLYNRVLDLDWVYPAGLSEFCGGDALFRRSTLQQCGGFDASLIAGEEPELCHRLRQCGYHILHLDVPMTLHDLAIDNFQAYWRRAFRAGHAYATIAHRCRNSKQPLWQKESLHNLLHGSVMLMLPLVLLALLFTPPLFAAMALLLLALLYRSAHRCRWKSPNLTTRWLYAMHSHLQHIPILFGQLAAWHERHTHQQRGLIEYK